MLGGLGWILVILMILGGILGISGLIVAKRPDAKAMIDKLVPFQALIGVGLLGLGLWLLIKSGPIGMFRGISRAPILALFSISATYGSILLGFLFGMPQIAKWIPGESAAETKAMELSKKLAPFQLIIGGVVAAGGVIGLLLGLRIMNPY